MAKKENKIQSALTDSLAVYFDRHGVNYRQFVPYANQQGAGLRKYCADVLGLIDGAELLLIELKERDCQKNLLLEFKPDQHGANVRFEHLGIPIGYVYNSVDVEQLPYYFRPNDNWPVDTLKSLKRATPTQLPSETPDYSNHNNFYDWIERAEKVAGGHGQNSISIFGKILGVANVSADLMRNGMLVLLYSVEQKLYQKLDSDQLCKLFNTLSKSASLDSKRQGKLKDVLHEASEVFNLFSKKDQPTDEDTASKFKCN